MVNMKLGVVESRFADIIWQREPLHSRKLAEVCAEELGWKRPTTYNVLRKLCDKGIFRNEGGTVTSVLSRQEYYGIQGENFVEEEFQGSLPAFVAAFTARKKLSDQEIDELIDIINKGRGKGNA